MEKFKAAVTSTVEWILADYRSNHFRFFVEVVAWAISIGCALAMAVTVPEPPLKVIYPVWVAGCLMYGWAAWTRRSFGMLANYVLLTVIDTVGMIRVFVS